METNIEVIDYGLVKSIWDHRKVVDTLCGILILWDYRKVDLIKSLRGIFYI